MILSERDKQLIEIVESGNLTFSEACYALELDPFVDLIGGDFTYVDFSNSDISGFNFTDADLSYSTGVRITGQKHAIFENTKIRNSIFDKKSFTLPHNFRRLVSYPETYQPFIVQETFTEKLELELSTDDKVQALQEIIDNFNRMPEIICSALWLVDKDWQKYPERFEIFDSLLTHEYPSVCIETLKAIERCVTIKEIAFRYKRTILGKDWEYVRQTIFRSDQLNSTDPYFKAKSAPIVGSWLDPVEMVSETYSMEENVHVYVQPLFEEGMLPSSTSFVAAGGGSFFNGFARRTNILFKFDGPLRSLSMKKYYKRLGNITTIDFYKRLFFVPSCFNLLNILNPKFALEDFLTEDFIKFNAFLQRNREQPSLFDFQPKNKNR